MWLPFEVDDSLMGVNIVAFDVNEVKIVGEVSCTEWVAAGVAKFSVTSACIYLVVNPKRSRLVVKCFQEKHDENLKSEIYDENGSFNVIAFKNC